MIHRTTGIQRFAIRSDISVQSPNRLAAPGRAARRTAANRLAGGGHVAAGNRGVACSVLHGALHVRTNPPGAVLYVDDNEIGVTPASHDFVYYGTRKIRLVKDGYETLTVLQPIPAPWYEFIGLDFIAENVIPRRDSRRAGARLPVATTTDCADRTSCSVAPRTYDKARKLSPLVARRRRHVANGFRDSSPRKRKPPGAHKHCPRAALNGLRWIGSATSSIRGPNRSIRPRPTRSRNRASVRPRAVR